MESDLMDSDACEFCGGAMLFEKNAEYLADQEKDLPSFIINGKCEKDNMTFCNLGFACDSCPYNNEIKNETEGINEEIDNMLISSMINDIERVGEEKVWWEINHSELELRIKLIPIYIEAKQRILEG
jgi:hypothetical protein